MPLGVAYLIVMPWALQSGLLVPDAQPQNLKSPLPLTTRMLLPRPSPSPPTRSGSAAAGMPHFPAPLGPRAGLAHRAVFLEDSPLAERTGTMP